MWNLAFVHIGHPCSVTGLNWECFSWQGVGTWLFHGISQWWLTEILWLTYTLTSFCSSLISDWWAPSLEQNFLLIPKCMTLHLVVLNFIPFPLLSSPRLCSSPCMVLWSSFTLLTAPKFMRARKLAGNLRPSLTASLPQRRRKTGGEIPQLHPDDDVMQKAAKEGATICLTLQSCPSLKITQHRICQREKRFLWSEKDHRISLQARDCCVGSHGGQKRVTNSLITRMGAGMGGWQAAEVVGRCCCSIRTEPHTGTGQEKPVMYFFCFVV